MVRDIPGAATRHVHIANSAILLVIFLPLLSNVSSAFDPDRSLRFPSRADSAVLPRPQVAMMSCGIEPGGARAASSSRPPAFGIDRQIRRPVARVLLRSKVRCGIARRLPDKAI